MAILPEIASAQKEMKQWRHDLHAHPELGFEEERTSDFVASKLTEWGIPVTRGLAGTGVVGTLQGRDPVGRSIGLRAAIDFPASNADRRIRWTVAKAAQLPVLLRVVPGVVVEAEADEDTQLVGSVPGHLGVVLVAILATGSLAVVVSPKAVCAGSLDVGIGPLI